MRRCFLWLAMALPVAGFAIIPDYGTDTIFKGVGSMSGASCVAIAPHWAITAKHVGGMSVSIDGVNATAFERFDEANGDISLLHFNATFGTYYDPNFSSVMGSLVTMVGFGSTGTPNSTGITITGGGGVRRAANNIIDDFKSVTFDNVHFFDSWVYDLDGPTGNGSLGGGAVNQEGGLWGGDSGGAWLINNGGAFQLVAVNSWIDDSNNNNAYNDYGDIGGGVALKSYEGFIRSHIATVPEPMSMAALGLGLAALLRRRRTNR